MWNLKCEKVYYVLPFMLYSTKFSPVFFANFVTFQPFEKIFQRKFLTTVFLHSDCKSTYSLLCCLPLLALSSTFWQERNLKLLDPIERIYLALWVSMVIRRDFCILVYQFFLVSTPFFSPTGVQGNIRWWHTPCFTERERPLFLTSLSLQLLCSSNDEELPSNPK